MKINNTRKKTTKMILLAIMVIIPSIVAMVYAQQTNFHLNNDKGDKVTKYPNGQINWSKNLITATSRSEISLVDQKNFSLSESIVKETAEDAKENLYQIMMDIKVDDYRSVKKVLETNAKIEKCFSKSFNASLTILEPILISNTVMEVTAKIPLYGENSLSTSLMDLYIPKPEDLTSKLNTSSSIRNTEYGKVIIDVRGMNFKPSVFPKIYYEECSSKECEYGVKDDYEKKELYSPELIPVDKRCTNYYIKYTSDPFRYKDEVWVGYKKENTRNVAMALYISALKVDGEYNTDIIIHKSDADRLMVNYSNIKMMLSGNIVILAD